MRPSCLVAVLIAGLSGAGLRAEDPVDAFIDALSRVRKLSETALAPDGSQVAWVQSVDDKQGFATRSTAIFVKPLRDGRGEPRRVTARADATGGDERGLAWSPDSQRLAFLSDAEKKDQLQLYVTDANGGAPRQITHLKGSLADPAWSPDGKLLAFLFIEDAQRVPGAVEAVKRDTGLVEQKIDHQRIAIVDPATGKVRQISPADLYVHEYDWSPDGQAFAATAAPGPGDDNWYIAQLYRISRESGQTTSIFKTPMQMAVPRWSPDGKSVAFIGGLMSDEGANGGDIYQVPAGGGEARNLTPGIKSSPSWIAWRDAGHLLFTDNVRGESGINVLTLSGGSIERLWIGAESITTGSDRLSLTRDGMSAALIRHSFSNPPEVWTGPIGAWKQVSNVNAKARPAWGDAKSLHWKSDGMDVQGWLLYPRDYDAARRYPLIVSVHGGPAASDTPHWPGVRDWASAMSARGYFVLMPNPRGSFGMGATFTQANVKDFGYGDFRDIMAGVDEVLKTLPVDANRMGLTGWSYGGYMTMFGVTQTTRFRAAVAGAGIANWQSYYGENQIDQWMIPYFGASVYDDPSVYARSSPITFITKVKTPTLVVVGERDGECPAPQSYEFWHALKTLGVETQFVIYPNEGHAFRDPKNIRDVSKRAITWFDDHLK